MYSLVESMSRLRPPSDAAATGLAAAGVAGNYLFNAVTNPCRSGNRNKGTNNRIFGGNTGSFLLGGVAGFTGAQLINNAQAYLREVL